MRRMNTLPVMVPSGCTSLVQLLDVCLNKPLTDQIRTLADAHYIDHMLECLLRSILHQNVGF